MIHGNNREGGDDSSEESVNDEEEDEDDDGGGASVRMLPPPNPSVSLSSSSSSLLNHHRKSFPPAKSFRAAPAWKAADEMIGVSVPRKARSGRAVEEIERNRFLLYFQILSVNFVFVDFEILIIYIYFFVF